MKRRNFIKNAALCAVAVSTSGFIRFNGDHFEGDCETTTDILGPFYRPGAPVRRDMRMPNAKGQLVVLSGNVKHKDCTTPLKNACVEIWHCDGSGVYDNDSPDFNYRAKTYSDETGNYQFDTIIPVPYEVGGGVVRPAHFHIMFSAEGYQSLITQLYFTGDKYLAKDASSASLTAKKRILNINDGAGGEKSVSFNVTMLDKIPADPAVIERLAGTYINTSHQDKKQTFYKRDELLWVENPESINGGYPLMYVGNNSFKPYGRDDINLLFSPESNGAVKLLFTMMADGHTKETWESVKAK
jgi:protocatechuate 3,4-dioxygenase beta subunit